MRWLDKLERHLGFLAIPYLLLFVIGGQIITTLLTFKEPALAGQLILVPSLVIQGEWWRLLSWLIVPPHGLLGSLLAIFWFQFMYMMSQSLEAEWGSFKSTVYLLLGWALPTLSSMLLWQFFGVQVTQDGWYFSVTLQLAFAALAPDVQILLFFILPVRMRWVAWFLGALLLWQAISRGLFGGIDVLAGVGNYLLFFASSGWQAWRLSRQSSAGRQVFAKAKREAEQTLQRACTTCGRGPDQADLRLCTCSDCGEHGRFFCTDDLKAHLSLP